MINLDHVHFQHKTVIYFVQTFGNIYTIVPFCKHALRVFHAIAWLILLAHAQTNLPPVKAIFHCGRFARAGGATNFNHVKNQSRGQAKKVECSSTSASIQADKKCTG